MGFEVEIVNLHDYHGEHIYVGRGSPLGNPFSHVHSKFDVSKVSSRSEAIEKYKEWLEEKLLYNTIQNRVVSGLVSKLLLEKKIILGCFCKPLKCHAEIIAEIVLLRANKLTKEMGGFFEDQI